jgi:hypothetical protein
MPFGVCNAAVQLTTPGRLRAKAAALLLLVTNLLAVTTGPTTVALLTDYVFADPLRVANSVAITCAGSALLASVLIWMTLAPYRRALSAAEASDASAPGAAAATAG